MVWSIYEQTVGGIGEHLHQLQVVVLDSHGEVEEEQEEPEPDLYVFFVHGVTGSTEVVCLCVSTTSPNEIGGSTSPSVAYETGADVSV